MHGFCHLALQQLEDESELIRSIAAAKISEFARIEIGYMEAYSNKSNPNRELREKRP